jgi:uncharacterized metal-binding protein YceD (DUF177 family)
MKQSIPAPAMASFWSVPVAVADIPETGRHIELQADGPIRDAIAGAAGLSALPRLDASFDLVRHGSNGLRLTGRVTATVVQGCVVTLEPVESEIDEAVDLTFLADPGLATAAGGLQSLDADEPPELLRDGTVDLGAVATEFLLLGIDPYPRKPGAVFDAPAVADPSGHPFAALAALKKGEKPPRD